MPGPFQAGMHMNSVFSATSKSEYRDKTEAPKVIHTGK